LRCGADAPALGYCADKLPLTFGAIFPERLIGSHSVPPVVVSGFLAPENPVNRMSANHEAEDHGEVARYASNHVKPRPPPRRGD